VHRFRRGVGRIVAAVAELSTKEAELQAECSSQHGASGGPLALRVVPYYHTGADQVQPSPLRSILTLLNDAEPY
jgi:hypothetical protein